MRRPLLILFTLLLVISFIYTHNKSLDNIKDKEKITIEGTVKDKIEKLKYDQYKIGNYLVNDYSKNLDIKTGKIVKINGSIKSLNSMNYEDFDYGKYIKSMGYKGVITSKDYKIIGENIFYINVGKVKNYIRDTFRYLYKDSSDFINSLILGQKDDLSKEEKDMFSRTGTSHVIAISGLHTGILCTMIAVIIRGINRFYKLIIITLFMILYCIIVGFSPSISRAIAFMIIMYLAIFIDRKRDGISTLSLIGTLLIINNPYIIYNTSFQLSFLATLSIIYFYKIINRYLKSSIISVSIAANILTMPVVYYTFKGLPILFILGNIIVIPVISIIMSLSIISIILFEISIFLSKILAYLNKSIIIMVYYLLEKLSAMELAYIEVNNPKLFYVTFYYILIFSYMIYRELRIMKEQENGLQGYYKEY
ncbi:ComEC/Rec2 family competence protein [Terrisporobacter sp.]|uniref:ComEC/Rec2 family competence protein n=1 Tax=Terrisporobacter sp. TaxID=1965305 RepID=UPI0026027A3C|nr:ComEC/Rec2 family competence protein [Terrisporobacter sp.]